jgi:Mn-containing catalase
MFEAALGTIHPNFPPGILQSDPKHSNTYFNLSTGAKAEGPWNQGKSTLLKEQWQLIENPLEYVVETNGLVDRKPEGTKRTVETVADHNKKLAKERSSEIKKAVPEKGETQWSEFPEPTIANKKSSPEIGNKKSQIKDN